jgi:hypothetical protein
MVELRGVPRRLATTQAPQSRVSPSDIAAPYRAFADALGSFVPGLNEVARKQGEEAGFQTAVTTGDDGLPQVKTMPLLTGAYGEGYNRAAKWKYLADLGPAVDNRVLEAKLEFAGNPSGFQAWAKGYIGDLTRREKDPALRASVEKMTVDATSQAWRGLTADHQRTVLEGAAVSLDSRRTALANRAAALARNGGTDTPEYRSAMADYDAIGQELSGNPAFGVAPEVIAEQRNQTLARHEAEATIGFIVNRGVPAAPGTDAIVDRILGVESGGDPLATNDESSATGAGQFINSTWLAVVGRYRPDLAEGRTNADILALRTDAALSREMTDRLASENAAALADAGHTASGANLYLGHFLGPSGAIGVLEAAPDTPIREALIAGGMTARQADAAIDANKTVLEGKSAGDVRGWARRKMGNTADTASLIEEAMWDPDLPLSPEDRRRYVGYANAEFNRVDAEQKHTSGVAQEAYERSIIDAAAEVSPIFARSDIEGDPRLTESTRNTLLKAYDTAAKDLITQQRAYDRFASGDGSFNPFESDDRNAIDGIYKTLGGDGAALKTVVDRTGVVPPTVVKTLRGGLVSTDPQAVGASLQVASNLIAANPNAFAGHDGASEIETAATTFRHYIDDLGYTADQASAKIAEANTPEYRARVASQVKGEDMNEIVKKHLSADELRSAFDESWMPGKPELGFSPEVRQGMFGDYTELFRDRYGETGDIGLAKSLALDQLKRVWGVTTINGSETIMRYPPERAPGFAGVESAGELIAAEALADIQAEFGAAVERDSLRILPLPGATAEAYKSGQPVPYTLAWADADGVIHTLNPGRGFVLDAASVKTRQTTERGEAFTGRQERQGRMDAEAERATRRQAGIADALFGGGDPNVNRTAKGDRLAPPADVVPPLTPAEATELRRPRLGDALGEQAPVRP